MLLGVTLPQTTHYDLAKDVTVFARAAEEIGFDSLWAYERILTPLDTSGIHGLYGMDSVPWPPHYGHTTDALVTLTLAAAVTSRAALGTGVLVPGLHLPFRLARSLAALDAASGGRVIAGLGSGWSIDEFEASGSRPLRERGKALDEFLDIAGSVWGADPVAFDNGRYRLAPSLVNPKPAHRIPTYLAATNDVAFGRITRRADGWLPTGLPPAQVGAILRERDIRCIFQVGVRSLTPVPSADRAPYTGSIEQIIPDIAELAAEGVDHVYVTLASATPNVSELIAAAEALHTGVRAAGL